MSKIIGTVLVLCVSAVLLAGCSFDSVLNMFDSVADDAKKSYENVEKEITDVTKKITDTKNEIEDKIEKGKKVIDAINDFTKPYEASPAATEVETP